MKAHNPVWVVFGLGTVAAAGGHLRMSLSIPVLVVWSQVAQAQVAPSHVCVFCGDWVTRSNLCPLGTFSSEANDLALRLAWQYTGHKDIITLEKWVLLSSSSDNSIRVSFNEEKPRLPSVLEPITCVLLWSFFSFFVAPTTATSRRSSTSAPTSTTSCQMACGIHPCMWWVLLIALPCCSAHNLNTMTHPSEARRGGWGWYAGGKPLLQVPVHADVQVCHLPVHCGLTLSELEWAWEWVMQHGMLFSWGWWI